MAARRLNKAAGNLVRARIIAGDTNNEIREALNNAGYPSDIADQTIGHYRASEEVLDAIRRRDEEAIQTGLSQRSERVLRLAASAKRFERMLVDDGGKEFARGIKGLAALHREYRETLKDIGALVDPMRLTPMLNIDLESLDDEQIKRLSRGVPLELVLATPSKSRGGAEESSSAEAGPDAGQAEGDAA